MQCSQCGYMMNAFDKECPRCQQGSTPTQPPSLPTSTRPTAQSPILPSQSTNTQIIPQTALPSYSLPAASAAQVQVICPHCHTQMYIPENLKLTSGLRCANCGRVFSATDIESGQMGIASMILGIVGIVLLWVPVIPFVCFVLALTLGIIALKRRQQGRGMAIAGVAMGSVGLSIYLIIAAFMGLVFTSMGAATREIQRSEEAKTTETVISNTSANITSTGSEFWKQNTITVTGDAKNTGTSERSLTLEARIYNSSNVMVASGTSWERIPAGETKRFDIRVSDSTQTNPFTYKVVIK